MHFPLASVTKKGGVSKFFSYSSIGSGCVKAYLYHIKSCLYIYVWYAIGYLGIFVLLFLSLSGIAAMYRKYISHSAYLAKLHPLRTGVLIAALYIGYAFLQYHLKMELFQVGEGADAYYYMNPDIWDEMGRFSLEKTAAYLFTFRGYFTIVVAVMANASSQLSGIQPIYFYFIYYGVVVSFAIVDGMPKLYRYFTDREASDGMCFMAYAIFFLFWNNFYFYALTDIPAAMFAILGVAWMLEGLKEGKGRHIFFGSVFAGISINYRNAYNYVFYFALLWMVAEAVRQKKGKLWDRKKIVGIVGCVVGGILLVSWPQAAINFARGHMGLFTYDAEWIYDAHSGNVISAVEADFTNALHRYAYFSSPPNVDWQLFQIDQIYYADKYYSTGDMLYIILANPLQFLLGYAKKIFWAMCIGIETAYGAVAFPDYVHTFAKLFHFYLIGNYLYLFVSDRVSDILTWKSRLWLLGMGVVTVGLQGFVHIEKRYILFYLLLIYFANAFMLGGYLKEGSGKRPSCKYMLCMAAFVFGSYVLERLLEYNFV